MHSIKRLALALSILAIAAAVLFFVLENQQSVALVLFGWSAPPVPLAILVLVALLAGLVVGPLLSGYIVLRSRRRLRRSLRRAEQPG
ncbi:lipopolysaccharide assembly protein LapA domain-containing protein [Pseudomonas fontis]|uniref:Lipopolysaccharide assembly protein LapA domain-containing protein n=1 Tax=Pseudomonas fontis TaxID=2942633 RepID=A0ABT5NVE3_9PSED|nr:lipopolysaccharide assembly protein LapA domain-containing protein [Pseudomonas fontis]MDD0975547.1 lipopolysaccharide assembly protein LapA domain-containing protein [Pseudomonas fontis]MDD0992161.1 lipopolysaccharide assembly protein LapA domain-containing protein [Pseudomonas fontis]